MAVRSPPPQPLPKPMIPPPIKPRVRQQLSGETQQKEVKVKLLKVHECELLRDCHIFL